MQAARRLYLYAMSGITLAVIAFGFVLLLQALLDGVFPNPEFGEFPDSRQQLSQAVAMLGVGIPVWAVHWWLVQRGLRPGRPEREAERTSEIRAVYLTGVLVVSLVVWVSSAIALLQWLVTEALGPSPDFGFQDPRGPITLGVTGFAIWLYHGLVRRRDLAAGPVAGAAAWLPRLYLYGVSLGALWAAVTALDAIIAWAVTMPGSGVDDDFANYYLIERAASGVAWGLVWLAHWMYATRLARDPGWRGSQERVSRTRAGAFVAAIVVAAAATLIGLASSLGAIIAVFLPEPGFFNDTGLHPVPAALLRTVPWAVVWFGHARAFRREPAAVDPLRALHQERLTTHGIAAVALAIGATGTGWILGYLVDVLLGGQRSAAGLEGSWFELRQWLPFAVVGLVAWLWAWRSVVARRRLDPVGEAQSTIRRAFLYLTLAVALVVGLAAAALILYRFVGIALDAGLGGNLLSELATPLGALITALAVLVYHALQLRADLALVAHEVQAATADAPAAVVADPGAVPAGPGAAVVVAGEPAVVAGAPAVDTDAATGMPAPGPAAASVADVMERRVIEIIGPPGADLDAAIAAARSALPSGIEIVTGEG